jgi:hypothetical protein
MKYVFYFLLTLSIVLVCLHCVGDAPVPTSAPQKTTLNAADYGLVPGCDIDCGKALNRLWEDAASNCVITIPPGIWQCATPIRWTDKNFTLFADQATLVPSHCPGAFFTVGMEAGTKGIVDNIHLRGLTITDPAKSTPIGLQFQNSSRCLIERLTVHGCGVGIREWVDQGRHSYFNIVQSCRLDCKIAIQQAGVPDAKWGLQTSSLKISDLDVDYPELECCFDFQGGNNNEADRISCQGGIQPYLVRALGGGGNRINFQYFEAKYPCRILSASDDNAIDTKGRNKAPFVTHENSGKNNFVK